MVEARRDAARHAEAAARHSYGRLLSILAARTADIAAAEDALADAFAAALVQWPATGVPDNPPAWLLTVARRALGRSRARRATIDGSGALLTMLEEERRQSDEHGLPDDRLKLMVVCAHPAIAVDAQAPLMLQTVLGLDAARIGAAFLVSPRAMGQKLVRAKLKIRDAGIAFAVPDPQVLAERTTAVLAGIHAAYGTAWEDVTGADPKRRGLSEEAIWLGRLVCTLLPDEPEAKGLAAMMLHCEARRTARRSGDGRFVPLRDQDVTLWSRPMIEEAEVLLKEAARAARPGLFQTLAAIQSLHVHQRIAGKRFTDALVALYDLLVEVGPSLGASVARAVAYAEHGETAAALLQLDGLPLRAGYQPWWAARARVLWLTGDTAGAREAATIAAGLSSDPAVRAFLLNDGFAFEA